MTLLPSRSVDRLTPEQRKGVEETLIRALRLRYPGCAVTVDWDGDAQDGPDTLPDRSVSGSDDDRGEDAA